MSKGQRLLLWVIGSAAVGLLAILGAANLFLGDLNQDEGWYLYAARLVSHGEWPYRDFAFTQAPVMPFVYALAQSWVERWGVAGGRLFSWCLGLLSALAAAGLSARLARPGQRWFSALLALVVIAGNTYQSYYTTVVKTYSLCAVFLSAGLLALTFARSRGWMSLLSGVLLVLAGGTRISAGGVAAVAFCWLAWQGRSIGWRPFLMFAAGSILTTLAVFLPLWLAAPDGFMFGVIEYHSGRSAGSLMQTLVFKAGFISRLVQAYFWPVAVAVVLLAAMGFKRMVPPADGRGEALPDAARWPGFAGMVWTALALVTLVHFSAPVPYEDYQVMLFPIFCAVLAPPVIARFCVRDGPSPEPRRTVWLLAAMLVVSVLSAFSSPINQSWFILGRDRIWWRMKEQPDLVRLQEVARWINEWAAPGELLLTQDTYLAVETGLSVPRGLEMGPFSYYPGFDRPRADRLRVLNRESLVELLETTPAPMAAFSGYGLSIYAPEVQEIAPEDQEAFWAIVNRRYDEVLEVPSFGQGHTELKVLLANDPAAEGTDNP